MTDVPFPLKPGLPDVAFRFTIRAARDLELKAGCNYQTLLARSQQVEAVVMLTCYGLRHADKSMTVDRAVDLVDAFVSQGGNIVALYEALQKAMNLSGIYGPPPTSESPGPTDGGDEDRSADPPQSAGTTL